MLVRDGHVVWLRDSVSVVMWDGRLVSLHSIMTDISALMEAKRAAAEQVNCLQQLINTIPRPIFWKNAIGRYQGCNKAFEDQSHAKAAQMQIEWLSYFV